ncbi:hypothetical protein FHETE_7052 [Fusarium heterosporum]|uniref:F-box domain-containing protein n=1 Tax=Fusarium heterosporum TaxID=42747 RepID=A0A8H5T7L3_FUSHE|nr:hypothetical protein FHETE_7052 [Fusarium heterosporum]
MSTRRSARLRDQPTQAVAAPDLPAEEPRKTTKRKAPATKTDDETVAKSRKKIEAAPKPDPKPAVKTQKARVGAGAKKTTTVAAQATAGATSLALSSLPQEILDMIFESIDDTKSLGRLSKTCKTYYALVTPQLYKRLDVWVSFHAHIAKLIRTIDPLLSIEQKKQLKKVGTYKGQQESFPSKVDQRKKPEIANFVKQALLGIGDPGKNHREIVHRYVDEAMKNMHNLEIVETIRLTEAIAKSLAEQRNLKALALRVNNVGERYTEAMAKIKNLQHLVLELSGYYDYTFRSEINIPGSLIRNSRSTLRSLIVDSDSFTSLRFNDLGQPGQATESGGEKLLPVLESFSMSGSSSMEPCDKETLANSIDFVALKELKFGSLSGDTKLIFEYLADSFLVAHQDEKTEIKLRNLSMNMELKTWGVPQEARQATLDAKIRFISSFDTLSSLTLDAYGEYRRDLPNPGLETSLLQGILKHEHLTRLKISTQGYRSDHDMPRLEPDTVSTLINGLSNLKELEFFPSIQHLDEIGKILSRGRNLTSITIITMRAWTTTEECHEQSKEFVTNVAHGVLERNLDSDVKAFKWEEHSTIQHVRIDYIVWELGSKLGKAKKGMKKANKFTVASKPKREVMYREITDHMRKPMDYGLDPTWMNRVAKDLI